MSESIEMDLPECSKEASTIQAIDKGSVHRICSGQVVLTLSTAVKELVENSIDAGATSVEVKLKDYGSETIEVIDNGSGVEQENFEGLTLKHHTSKLQDFDDLVNVETFGFRGEALSSLCALSDMVITTRHKSADIGTRLEFDLNGKIMKSKAVPRQIGTTVFIQNLFHTLPVRHKEFSRNLKKEFVKLVQVLNAYCIINTGVRITCSNQTAKGSRSVVVSTNGNGTMKENIANVFSVKQLSSLLEFKQIEPDETVCEDLGLKPLQLSETKFRVDGFVSKCEHGQGRSTSDRQFIFINKRPCDVPKIMKVVNEVYHSYNRHQNPFVALSICMEKESVDVNVTPDKRQVFLEGERLLWAVIKSSLIKMFESTTSVYKMNNTFSIQASKQNSSHFVSALGSGRQTDSPARFSGVQRNSIQDSQEEQGGGTSLSSSLMKLKRSFSSAFAKNNSSSIPSNLGSDKGTKSGLSTLNKARSLPSSSSRSITQFLSRFSPEKIKHITQSPSLSASGLPVESAISDNATSSSMDNSVFFSGDDNKEKEISETNCRSDNVTEISPVSLNGYQEKRVSDDVFYTATNPSQRAENSILNNGKHSVVMEHHPGFHRNPDVQKDMSDHNGNSENREVSIDISQEDRTFGTVIPEGETESETNSVNGTSVNMENGVSNGGFESKPECSISASCERNNAGVDDASGDNDTFITDRSLHTESEDTRMRKERTVSFSMSRLRERMTLKEDTQSASNFHRNFRAKIRPDDNTSAEDELQREIRKSMFVEMEILGQFNLGFIITRLGSDLFIVDQHATDEKYNFEMLQRHTVIQSQKMIVPQNLELTASNETILVDNLEIFKKNGFDFLIKPEALPTQRIQLVSAPVSKNWNFGKEDIEELLFMLTDTPNVMCRPSRVRMMFASRSCRKSIMIGTALKKSEMKTLVCHMGEIDQPWNCPHGRPTMRHLFNMDMLPSR